MATEMPAQPPVRLVPATVRSFPTSCAQNSPVPYRAIDLRDVGGGVRGVPRSARAVRFVRLEYPNVSAHEKANFSALELSLNGIQLAQLAIGVLGILLITSEYSTGLIRATFAAVPQRRTVMAAKAIIFTVATLIVSEVGCFIAFFVGQAFLAPKHLEAHIGDPGVIRAVIGGGLYLAVLGLLALGLGTAIRTARGRSGR